MARTLKEIDNEIKALKKEREEMRYIELAKKYSPILDLLEESNLSIAKLKKIFINAFTDEPSVTMISASMDGKEKIIEKEPKVSKKGEVKSKTARKFKPKLCVTCGTEFIPKSPRQIECSECKLKAKEINSEKKTLSFEE